MQNHFVQLQFQQLKKKAQKIRNLHGRKKPQQIRAFLAATITYYEKHTAKSCMDWQAIVVRKFFFCEIADSEGQNYWSFRLITAC